MRWSAIVLLAALFPMVMPFGWMEETHEWLGLGKLPSGPIIGYLTRSCSLLYAYHGGLVLFLSFDVRRWLPVIQCLGWLTSGLGVALLGIDCAVGVPGWWILCEGPFLIALGGIFVYLAGAVKKDAVKEDAMEEGATQKQEA